MAEAVPGGAAADVASITNLAQPPTSSSSPRLGVTVSSSNESLVLRLANLAVPNLTAGPVLSSMAQSIDAVLGSAPSEVRGEVARAISSADGEAGLACEIASIVGADLAATALGLEVGVEHAGFWCTETPVTHRLARLAFMLASFALEALEFDGVLLPQRFDLAKRIGDWIWEPEGLSPIGRPEVDHVWFQLASSRFVAPEVDPTDQTVASRIFARRVMLDTVLDYCRDPSCTERSRVVLASQVLILQLNESATWWEGLD